jgi:hypothetical protein
VKFISRSNDRTLPADYTGDVLVWDIDKTYLDTHFSSWRGLMRIPFELAIDKRAMAGSVPLLRGLRHGGTEQSSIVPLYFISGSPIQLRKTIERKMVLDGVDFDGITFKDQWGLVRAGRAKDVKAQIGYKLKSLLALKRDVPGPSRFFLFGDDVEADAEVFVLFGRVCAGELRDEVLTRHLADKDVHPVDIAEIRTLCDDVPVTEDPVERVFILLSEGGDPNRFSDDKVVATHSYLQTALVLAELGRVRPQIVGAVAKDLRRRQVPEFTIRRDIDDASRRLGVSAEICAHAER